MSMPFYVSPEQIIKDKADYARKGISRGRSVVVLQFDEGILFVACLIMVWSIFALGYDLVFLPACCVRRSQGFGDNGVEGGAGYHDVSAKRRCEMHHTQDRHHGLGIVGIHFVQDEIRRGDPKKSLGVAGLFPGLSSCNNPIHR